MNILSKKMILFGVALFLTKSVCAMDLYPLGKDVNYVNEEYVQELNASFEQEELRNKALGIMPNKRYWDAVNNPQEYNKEINRTLPRTPRKVFKGQNREKK